MHCRERTSASLLRMLASAVCVFATTIAFAQSGTSALTAQFDQVCAGAAPGSALVARCATVFASTNPNARSIAAARNDLEEIPGAGRGNAKDQWPSREEVSTLLTPKLALFASLDHGHSFRSNNAIEAAFDADSTTFTAGIDWHPANRWQLGLTFNRSRDNQQFRDSFGKTSSDATGAIAVASWNANDFLMVDGYLGVARGSQDILRVVSFIDNSAPVAETANPDLRRSLGGLALDASVPHGALEWRGSLGFDTARTIIDRYTESGGSGFDLIVPQRATPTERGRIDVALAGTFSQSWGVWQPELRVGLRHEFANDAHLGGVRFVDDTNATIVHFDTGAPDRDWVQAGFSTAFTFTHGNSAFIALGREFGHSTSTSTTYTIGWRIEL